MRNPWLCLTIVGFIGLGGIIGGVGMVLLAVYGKDIPPALAMLTAATFGSLSSFLVQPPRGSVGTGPPNGTNGNGKKDDQVEGPFQTPSVPRS